MQPITYSLKNQHKRSDQFYLELSDFTDVVLREIMSRCGSLVADLQRTPNLEKRASRPSREEYAFDVLVLGVLWRVYAPKVGSLASSQQRLLGMLVRARRKSQVLKPVADFLRGMISGVSLFRARPRQAVPHATLHNLVKLMGWLEAVGEFEEEVGRLHVLREFLAGKNMPEQNNALEAVAELAEWFESASLKALGNYTANVEPFLRSSDRRYRWREDYLFTRRQRVEYHLNMVGTEIMNRSFRQGFLQAEHRFIFVPPCMSSPKDGKCQATATPYGERCAACTPTCQVHQVTKLGEKYGLQVFMIPDSFSPLSKSKGQGLGDIRIGVVGVSCPLTIISGGYEMQRMGIPAQGLLLDHCGCSWHWDPGKGIVTEINLKQLQRILEEDIGSD